MKKILLVTVLSAVMAMGGTLYAQGRGWGHSMMYGNGQGYHYGYMMGSGHMEYLRDELKLTDTQVEKIIKIDAEFRLKYFQNRGNIDKITALREEHRKAVNNVLTDEQKKKLEENYNTQRNNGFCPFR